MLGVAVGSQDLIVVRPNEVQPEIAFAAESNGDQDDDRSDQRDQMLVLPYNDEGLQTLLGMADGTVILAGNRHWAKALAYAIQHHGVDVRYVAPRKAERGQVRSYAKFLQIALAHGVTGKPFFGARYKIYTKTTAEDAVQHPWVELAAKTVIAANDLRRCKHRILNEMRLIFPELLNLGTKLWGKKSVSALQEMNFGYFRCYNLELHQSLAGINDARGLARKVQFRNTK